ncbi:MAG: VanW family protein [Syntrophomonadaceae bacterium]|jgi:vancomycin resistance protein YoaR
MSKKFYFMRLNDGVILLMTFFISLSIITAWFDKLERDLYGVKRGVTLDTVSCSRLMPSEVRLIVENMALRYEKIPVEPRINKETGKIIDEQPGCIVDVEKTVANVMAAGENERVKLITIPIKPRFTRLDIEKATSLRGDYSTWFRGSGARLNNIQLAVKSLNNTLIWPENTFSFNETIGPRTPERGYLPAPVILGGGKNIDYGGGVCQVSSTLYNAALQAGLQICERHTHSRPVGYVRAGMDAAVAYDYLDLKLKNRSIKPVIIKAGLDKGRIWTQIWGEEVR